MNAAIVTSALVATLFATTWAGAAVADTIYLVNGRKIHTESATIDGDRVIFTQFGGTVAIPLDQVVRVVDDDETERPAPRPALAPEQGAPSAGLAGTLKGSTATLSPAAAGTTERRRITEYWIGQINDVDARITRIQSELDRLPQYSEEDERMFRFSGQVLYFIAEREKWQRLMDGNQLHRHQLLNGARKAGVTPGALRDGLKQGR